MPPKRKRKAYRKLFKRPPKGHKHYGGLKAKPWTPALPADTTDAVVAMPVCEESTLELINAVPLHSPEPLDSHPVIEDIPEEPRVFVVADMQISWSPMKETPSPTESLSTNCELQIDQDISRLLEIHNMDSHSALDDSNEIQGINVVSEITKTVCASDINDLSSIAENETDGTLLKEVHLSVSGALPNNWFCAIKNSCVHLVYNPVADQALVQRSVTVGVHGQVSIVVHGEELSKSHSLWQHLPPPLKLQATSLHEFHDYLIAIVTCVRWYDICPGLVDDKYSPFLKLDKFLIYDRNEFKELRYVTTCRSLHCLKLIQLPAKRCKTCSSMKYNLDRRLKRMKCSPNVKTNKFLSTPQTKKKLMQERTREGRLTGEISTLIKQEGVMVDDALHNEVSDLIKKEESLSEVQNIFLKEQLKYAQWNAGCGI